MMAAQNSAAATAAAPAVDVADHVGLVLWYLRRSRYGDRRYGGGLEGDDLAQAGLLGLKRATELFEPARGVRFSTYALFHIRQAIRREVQNHGCSVRVPCHMQDRRRREGLRTTPYVARLDEPRAKRSDDPRTLLDDMPSEDPTPDAVLERREALRELAALLARAPLSSQERKVLRLRTRGRGMTLEAIGERLGLTRERIRQVEGNALRKIRVAAGLTPDGAGSLGREPGTRRRRGRAA